MKTTSDVLRCIIAIAQHGGLNKAANQLGRSPSSLSYLLQQYEQRLGMKVFQRTGHGLKLTDAGSQLVEKGQLLLADMAELEKDATLAGLGWGKELRIAVADVVPRDWLVSTLSPMRQEFPRTNLVFRTEVLSGAWESVLYDHADLIVGAPYAAPAGADLKWRFMGNAAFCMVVAPDHPLAAETQPISAATLRRHTIAVLPDSARNLSPMSFNVNPMQSQIKVTDMQMKREVQLQGLAYGSLPRYLVQDDLTAGRLVRLDPDQEQNEPLYLAWKSKNQIPPLAALCKLITDADKPWLDVRET